MSISITFDPSALNDAKYAALLDFMNRLRGTSVTPVIPSVPIAAEDSPAAGLDLPSVGQAFNADHGNPAAAFTQTEPSASEAFAGNALLAAIAPAQAAASVPAPSTASAPASNGVEVDANGLPWNAQIHAETKSKNKDGTWRNKRGVDPAQVAQVEAQLRQLMAIPAAGNAAASQAAPVPAAQPAVQPLVPASPVSVGNVPSAPGSASAPPSASVGARPVLAQSAVVELDFIGLVGKVAPMLQSDRLTQEDVKAACMAHGVAELALLSARPDLIGKVNTTIDAILATKPAA